MPIITKTVIVKWNGRQRKYYEEKGYIYTGAGKEFEVKIEDLAPSSTKIIKCKCDFCGDFFEKPYSGIPKEGPIPCKSKKCIYKRKAYTMKKNYGVENPFQLQKTKDKIKETNLERYGNESYNASEEGKKRNAERNLKQFGSISPFGNLDVQKKSRKTRLKRYGTEYTGQIEEVKKRIRQTNLERYGSECYFSSEEGKKRIAETNLKKYGAENIFASEYGKQKIKEYNLLHYGVEHVMQREESKRKYKETLLNNDSHKEASDEQIYLCNLLGGQLNYHVHHRKGAYVKLDIAFPENNFYIECDFGGHFVWPKIQGLNENDIFEHDFQRDSYLHKLGWKNFRFISRTDIMFDDDIMKKLIDNAYEYLSNCDDVRILCDYDNNTITCEPSQKQFNLHEYILMI